MPDHVDFILSQWEQEHPDLDVSGMAVLSRLFRLSIFAAREVEQGFRLHGLNQGEFDVLATLYRSGESGTLSPQQLIQSLLLSSGAMTNRLDRLQAAGLLERRGNPQDRRGVLVSLTARGRETIREALQDYLGRLDALLGPLAPPERSRLSGLLRKLLAAHDAAAAGPQREAA